MIRRKLRQLLSTAKLDFLLLGVSGLSSAFFVPSNWLKVETLHLKLGRLTPAFSGLRVALISDIHMGGWMNKTRLQQVAGSVLAQRPDVLFITGDFLLGRGFTESSKQWIEDLRAVLSPLAQAVPSFAVLGNHDYWTKPEAIREMLCCSGIRDLTNTIFTLTRAGEHLHLCGVDDIQAGRVRLNDAIAQLSDSGAAILLAHEPDFATQSAATGKFDLQVSGHTHGGQIVLPFYGPPILPYLGKKYPSGLYKVKDMFQYTNRGVGMDKFAVRFNCPAELTLFILESAAS